MTALAYRDLTRPGVRVAAMLVIPMLSAIALCWAHLSEATSFDYIAAGSTTLGAVQRTDDLYRVALVLNVASTAAVGVAYMAWMHRAYRDLEALGETTLRYSAGWTIGAWLVPFISLVRPGEIMSDLWRASNPERAHIGGWRNDDRGSLVTWWWALFLASTIVPNLVARVARSGSTASTSAFAHRAAGISELISIPAAILAIRMVLDLTSRIERRSASLADPARRAWASSRTNDSDLALETFEPEHQEISFWVLRAFPAGLCFTIGGISLVVSVPVGADQGLAKGAATFVLGTGIVALGLLFRRLLLKR